MRNKRSVIHKRGAFISIASATPCEEVSGTFGSTELWASIWGTDLLGGRVSGQAAWCSFQIDNNRDIDQLLQLLLSLWISRTLRWWRQDMGKESAAPYKSNANIQYMEESESILEDANASILPCFAQFFYSSWDWTLTQFNRLWLFPSHFAQDSPGDSRTILWPPPRWARVILHSKAARLFAAYIASRCITLHCNIYIWNQVRYK